MDPITGTLLAILSTILFYFVYRAWKVNQFWKERGIPYVKPSLFLGNAGPIFFLQKTTGQCHEDICKQFPDEPIIGFYDFMKPVLVIKQADIIEKILIKDFTHFVDHGFPIDETRNPLDAKLFLMTGKRWKALRNKLSPIFTTGKLRLMFESITVCGDNLIAQMENLENCHEVEMKEILSRFGTDVIGSCAFGIDFGRLTQPDNEFGRMSRRSLEMDTWQMFKFLVWINFPKIFKILNMSVSKQDVLQYFYRIIRDTVKYRRENDIQRNDFVQLMMQLQDKGYVELQTKDPDDDYLNVDTAYSTEKFELTNDQLTAQAFSFFTAGFEPITLSEMFTLYELSKQPEIQEKVRNEVQKEINKAGSLTYDALKQMNYLEQCIKETLRKYPPAQILFRVCTKEYTLPNGLKIERGQSIMIPLKVVHYDSNYFPEPDKYIPERFDPDHSLPSCAFIPFGNGPRICLAMRFALLEIKYCLAKLLLNYNFKLSSKTREPLTMNVRSFFTTPNEIIFNVSKISA